MFSKIWKLKNSDFAVVFAKKSLIGRSLLEFTVKQ